MRDMAVSDKIIKAQIKVFRERIRPNVLTLSEGTDIVRGVKGLRRPVIENADVKWSDLVQFLHPKIPDISIWDAFVEKYGHYLQFDENPLENKLAFVKELFEFVGRLDRSSVSPNEFTIIRKRPLPDTKGKTAKEIHTEKMENEHLYLNQYKITFTLDWVVKV